MTYTIPPTSAKAAPAMAFGQEMMRALQARGIPRLELARTVGIGRTALDHYRTGSVLPKTATARAIASVLDWPKLARIVEESRTGPCARPSCGQRFRNDGGSPKKYCSPACVRIAQEQRIAETRNRQAGATDKAAYRTAAMKRLKSAVRIADERAEAAQAAIAAMCAGCEPEGLCRDAVCPLRPFSPLPLLEGELGIPRTLVAIQRASWTPERATLVAAGSARRWAKPGERARQSERTAAMHAAMTPEEREAWRRKVGLAQKQPAERSRIATAGAATKRARRVAPA